MSAVLTKGTRIAGNLSYTYRHRRTALVNSGSNYYIFTNKHSCQKCNVDHWAVTIHSPLNFDCRKQEINPNEKLIIHLLLRGLLHLERRNYYCIQEKQGVMEIQITRPRWAGMGDVLLGVLMLEISCVIIEMTGVRLHPSYQTSLVPCVN